MVDPSATVAQAPVITVTIDSANADGPRALFELSKRPRGRVAATSATQVVTFPRAIHPGPAHADSCRVSPRLGWSPTYEQLLLRSCLDSGYVRNWLR